MMVEFSVRLYSSGQVQIPKRIVEFEELWVGTPIEVRFWNGRRSIVFKSRVGVHFRFVIPSLELVGGRLKHGDVFKISLEKLDKS
jgi:bifunctional DNA-binding transcriptional regulator/antitoxin component of YhaV-PrlF toxin-antitoxin module